MAGDRAVGIRFLARVKLSPRLSQRRRRKRWVGGCPTRHSGADRVAPPGRRSELRVNDAAPAANARPRPSSTTTWASNRASATVSFRSWRLTLRSASSMAPSVARQRRLARYRGNELDPSERSPPTTVRLLCRSPAGSILPTPPRGRRHRVIRQLASGLATYLSAWP